MRLKVKQINKAFAKLEMDTRSTTHKMAKFYYEDKLIIFTKLSFGSGDVIATDKIRQQLKLNETQFKDLIDCPLTLQMYIDILKGKGVIKENI